MTAVPAITIETSASANVSTGKPAAGLLGSVSGARESAVAGGTQYGAPLETESFRTRWQTIFSDLSEPASGMPAVQSLQATLAAPADLAAPSDDLKTALANQGMRLQSVNHGQSEPAQADNAVRGGHETASHDRGKLPLASLLAGIETPQPATNEAAHTVRLPGSISRKKHPIDNAQKGIAAPAVQPPEGQTLAVAAPVTVPVPAVVPASAHSSLSSDKTGYLTESDLASGRKATQNRATQGGNLIAGTGSVHSLPGTGPSAATVKQESMNTGTLKERELSGAVASHAPDSDTGMPPNPPGHAATGIQSASAADHATGPVAASKEGMLSASDTTAQDISPNATTTPPDRPDVAGEARLPPHSNVTAAKQEASKPLHLGAIENSQQASAAPQVVHPTATDVAATHAIPDASGTVGRTSDMVGQASSTALPATHDTFATLDASTGASAWIHAGPHHAEAGFQDPALGWVGVRAESASGGTLHASLVAASPDAAQTLSTHLAGLSTYLTERHPELGNVSVAAQGNSTASWSGQSNMGQNGQSGGQGGSGQSPVHPDSGSSIQGAPQISSQWSPESTARTLDPLSVALNYRGRSQYVSVRV